MKVRQLAPLPRLNGIPSADILKGHKDVHCRITKEEFVRCKIQLFQHGVSISKLISWLVKQVADENPHALKLVDELIKREIQIQMAGLRREVKKVPQQWYDEVDQDTIYAMIEEASGAKEIVDEDDQEH